MELAGKASELVLMVSSDDHAAISKLYVQCQEGGQLDERRWREELGKIVGPAITRRMLGNKVRIAVVEGANFAPRLEEAPPARVEPTVAAGDPSPALLGSDSDTVEEITALARQCLAVLQAKAGHSPDRVRRVAAEMLKLGQ